LILDPGPCYQDLYDSSMMGVACAVPGVSRRLHQEKPHQLMVKRTTYFEFLDVFEFSPRARVWKGKEQKKSSEKNLGWKEQESRHDSLESFRPRCVQRGACTPPVHPLSPVWVIFFLSHQLKPQEFYIAPEEHGPYSDIFFGTLQFFIFRFRWKEVENRTSRKGNRPKATLILLCPVLCSELAQIFLPKCINIKRGGEAWNIKKEGRHQIPTVSRAFEELSKLFPFSSPDLSVGLYCTIFCSCATHASNLNNPHLTSQISSLEPRHIFRKIPRLCLRACLACACAAFSFS
jgi:hypothetical protein